MTRKKSFNSVIRTTLFLMHAAIVKQPVVQFFFGNNSRSKRENPDTNTCSGSKQAAFRPSVIDRCAF
ncbi:MAG: hypothetical protein CMJ74_10605 [Planctomycetaceae bacterium]|nr:hypothetical protein [Planctomycetaceae bacterium]